MPEEIKDIIDKNIRQFKLNEPSIRWESKSKLHITIKFIGDVSSELYKDIADCLSEVCSKYKSISLKTRGIRSYPNKRNPRVVVLELEDNELITRLKRDIDQSLNKIGIEEDTRIFKPHITLGRIKNKPKLNFNGLGNIEMTFKINDISLISSKLTKSGSIYTIENSFKLY